jgi:hypothetical protein
MSTTPTAHSPLHRLPWQIWVVVAILSLEGIGNLMAIPNEPQAAGWLAAKCLFVVGLLRGWRPVFVLFLVVAGLHVLAFLPLAPFVSLLNLVLMLLVASTLRFYFPPAIDSTAAA